MSVRVVPAQEGESVVEVSVRRARAGEDALGKVDDLGGVAEGKDVLVVELAEGELGLPDDGGAVVGADEGGGAAVTAFTAPTLAVVGELDAVLDDDVGALADDFDALEGAGAGLAGGEVHDTKGAGGEAEGGEGAAVERLARVLDGGDGAHEAVDDGGGVEEVVEEADHAPVLVLALFQGREG